MSTFDATKPLTTDNYSTVFVPTLQNNFASLAFGLDSAYVSAYGTLSSGMKRINSGTGLIEQYNGTVWAALTMNYLRTDGSNAMTAQVNINNNIALTFKDSGGTSRRAGLVDTGNNLYMGDVDSSLSGPLNLRASAVINLQLAGTTKASLSGSGLSLTGALSNSGTDNLLRMINDNAYVAFWNSANSVRTGYIQGNTASNMVLMAENGAGMQIGTAGAVRLQMDTNGMMSSGFTPSGWSTTGRALELGSPGNAFYGYVSGNNNFSAGASYNGGWRYSATGVPMGLYNIANGVHIFSSAPAGTAGVVATLTTVLNIDASGNGTFAGVVSTQNGIQTTSYIVNSRNRIWSFGNSDAYGLSYFQGTSGAGGQDVLGIHFGTATSAGSLAAFGAGGTPNAGLLIQGGSAATARFAIGSQATISVDWSKSNYQTMTLTANVSSSGWSFANAKDGQTLTLKIKQDATGNRTWVNNAGIKWPGGTIPALSTAANAVDIVVFTFDAADGLYYATLAKGFA